MELNEERKNKYFSKCGYINTMDLKEIRKKAKEISEKEFIREAIRARKFSGDDTLRQGMNLIDFALRVRKVRHEND